MPSMLRCCRPPHAAARCHLQPLPLAAASSPDHATPQCCCQACQACHPAAVLHCELLLLLLLELAGPFQVAPAQQRSPAPQCRTCCQAHLLQEAPCCQAGAHCQAAGHTGQLLLLPEGPEALHGGGTHCHPAAAQGLACACQAARTHAAAAAACAAPCCGSCCGRGLCCGSCPCCEARWQQQQHQPQRRQHAPARYCCAAA